MSDANSKVFVAFASFDFIRVLSHYIDFEVAQS